MKKASALPPLTCRDSTPSPSFSANCVGEKIPQIVFLSVHIFWACFPVGRSPLAPPGVAERSFLSVLYLLPCSSAPVCHCQPADWGSRANRHSTQWTRRIIFVEGRDRDRSSHNSPHHQYFIPSRELDKKVSYLHRLLSAEYSAQLIWKELQQKGLSPASHCTPEISHWFVSDKF